MNCENCGSSLESYEGECFCPECTRYEVEELARQADDDARVLRLALAEAEPFDDGPTDDGPPF
jgi:uncharacterized Zn finger protein (UPF0148 family)